jgi:hypothetical protein
MSQAWNYLSSVLVGFPQQLAALFAQNLTVHFDQYAQ